MEDGALLWKRAPLSHRSQPAHAGSPQGLDGEEDGWPQHQLVGDIPPHLYRASREAAHITFPASDAWLETAPRAGGEGWV